MKQIQDYCAKQNKTIGEHSQDVWNQAALLKKLGYITDEHLFYLLKEACLHHDDGKANEEFAARIKSKKRFDESKEVSHNILSVYYLNPDDYSTEDYIKIACAILYHHDYCDENYAIYRQSDLIKKLLISEYSYEIPVRCKQEILGNAILDSETIQLKGFLHRCDYSASGGYQIEYPNDFLEDAMENMMKRWKRENPECHWNQLQNFCMENRANNIIALAPTGMGKTEAGLLWMGNSKSFFVLPIRTAINAIYDRIGENILNKQKLDERLAILHSESLQYYKDHTNGLDIMEYYDRGKNLSLPLNISTIDQLFHFVFKYKGYEMMLTTLSYSKIVIDEIQMYGPDMLAYLVFGLGEIYKLGGKIAIVTATLAPFIKNFLIRDAKIPFVEQQFTSGDIRHSVCVKKETLSVEDIKNCYYDNQKRRAGNKILVVCNTIKKAQALYDELRKEDDSLELYIFHSRFTKADRKQLENQIIEFGKTFQEDNGKVLLDEWGNPVLDQRNGIWISTSLVEVSLDIDFDYLFTELSELSGLFQRMGRCNRKGKKPLNRYNCFVYCDGSDVKRGNRGFIDPVLYEYSEKALEEVDGWLSEQQKTELINRFFTTENMRRSDFVKEYKNILRFLKNLKIGCFDKNEQRLRTILTQNVIPKAVYEENLEVIEDTQERLQSIEENLKNRDNCERQEFLELLKERIDLQETLRGFIVSIPKYEFNIYKKKAWEDFGKVRVNRYEVIPVMECHYDEKGFYPLNYEEEYEEVMIF